MITIEHIQYQRSGIFNAVENKEFIGELTYFFPDEHKKKMVLNHTWVGAAYRGRKIGDQLILEAIAFAKEHNLKINPTCSFVIRYFERHAEYGDLILS